MIKPFFLLAAVLLAAHVKAADKFLLYHVNKQVQWIHDGKKETAKRGVFLLPKQSIIISNNADVMLIQDDGKSLLLDKQGSFTFDQIKQLLKTIKPESVSKNFFAYVFEKFLSGSDGNEKQKVAAVVYRGKQLMQTPDDSSFVFTIPKLFWKADYPSAPHRIEIIVNGVSFDTILRRNFSITIPQHLTGQEKKAGSVVQWRCYPADSKQPPPMFLLILPAQKDSVTIQKQLMHLRKTYQNRKSMLQLMEKDLFERWLDFYSNK